MCGLDQSFAPCELRGRGFYGRQKALKVASRKMAKYEKSCSDNQHTFIAFAFDVFGFLAPEDINLIHRIQKIMHNNVMSPKSMNGVLTKFAFVIQKDLTAQLIICLSSIHV